VSSFSFTELDVLSVNPVKNRRTFLKLLGASGFATATYSYFRGIRIPPLIWEPGALATEFSVTGAQLASSDVIQSKAQVISDADISFRAFNPEPVITIHLNQRSRLRLSINNIALDAVLQLNTQDKALVSESIEGITRVIEIADSGQNSVQLYWKLPHLNNFRFAAIGDSGGGQELAWCIQRANALGAKFLLHLGDINYQSSDYQTAIELFNQAPIPCYVSIGNHDFHDFGSQHQQFTDDIGPLNHHFTLGNTRFINLDTASNTLPYAAGNRGRLFDHVIGKQGQINTIAFTHRPLFDPRAGESHDIGSDGERDWLIDMLHKTQTSTLLSGHLHTFAHHTISGINNIIVGQGLGHQDILTNSDYSKMAIGQVSESGAVKFEFLPLSMPMEMHCHPRTDEVKQSIIDPRHTAVLAEIEAACEQAGDWTPN